MKKVNCVNSKCELESKMATMGGGRLRIQGETYIPLPESTSKKPKVVKAIKQGGGGSSTTRSAPSAPKRKVSPKKAVASPKKSIKRK